MSFDELPPDAQPPRLEEGDDRATDREASASDAPPAAPSRRRRASRTGTDAASPETAPTGETPARTTRRRAPAEANDKETNTRPTRKRGEKQPAAEDTSVVSASGSIPPEDAAPVLPSDAIKEPDAAPAQAAPTEAAPLAPPRHSQNGGQDAGERSAIAGGKRLCHAHSRRARRFCCRHAEIHAPHAPQACAGRGRACPAPRRPVRAVSLSHA